jgi:PD-(D/E)XK nuclease superfamily
MTTVARVHTERRDASWYTTAGEPLYEIPKADGKGTRAPTLADAKKRGDLLPRVTTILGLLDKPALNDWKVEQGVLAVMTTPQLPGESMDAFVHRVLHVERVQDQEAATARNRGTEIHSALQSYFNGEDVAPELLPWISPVALKITAYGERVTSEKILVGDGYAGRTDLILMAPDCWWIFDFKTSKTMPDPKKSAYVEHRLQLAAYAAAFEKFTIESAVISPGRLKPIRTANAYISSIVQGSFTLIEHQPDWQTTYERGFRPLVTYWQWLTGYRATQ